MKTIQFMADRDDKGYSLFIDNPEEAANEVKTALKNGYTEIIIKEASEKQLAENNLLYKSDFEIFGQTFSE